MFVRNENFRQFISFYPVISTIIALNAVLFLVTLVPPLHQLIYGLGVGSNFHVALGQYWRLLTPVFLHGSFSHFLFNNFSLVLFAPALEVMLGRQRFLLLYLGAGLLGNIGTYFAGGMHYNYHLGASGAVYGILGFYFAMILFRPQLLDPNSSQVVKTILVFGAIYSVIMPNINIYAHFFGFLSGVMFGHLQLQGKLQPGQWLAKKQHRFSSSGNSGDAGREQKPQGGEREKVVELHSHQRNKQKDLRSYLGPGIVIILMILYLLDRFF